MWSLPPLHGPNGFAEPAGVYVPRALERALQPRPGKVTLLYGARQTGKTTMLRRLFPPSAEVRWWNADDADVRVLFREPNASRFAPEVRGLRLLVLDEAQRLDDVGLALKILVDRFPGLAILATGSSSFELANRTQEALTGRKRTWHLHALAFSELVGHHGLLEERRHVARRLIYGSYPEVVTHLGEEREVLRELATSYLYRDVLRMDGVRKPDRLADLLRALALQVGQEVSYPELGATVGLDQTTTRRYLDLLEQAFVVFRLRAYSRNHRREIRKGRKIYFHDNGIRNAVLGQFAPWEQRADRGALWENYLVSERRKLLDIQRSWALPAFWRTHDQQEIDYLEEEEGRVRAWEFKSKAGSDVRFPGGFRKAYPEAATATIHPDNLDTFLLPHQA